MYTKINGDYYNIKDFKHPGGIVALKHIENRDGTSIFNSYHNLFSEKIINKTLSKYKINYNPGIESENVEFTINNNLKKDLIEGVKEYFINNFKNNNIKRNIKASNFELSKSILFFIIHIISIYFWLSGWWIFLFLYPMISWISAVNTFHDATHFSLTQNKLLNLFFCYSGFDFVLPIAWFHQHNIAHHNFPNIYIKDEDLHYSNYFLRNTNKTKYKKTYKVQDITFFISFLFSYVGIAIIPNINNMLYGRYYKHIKNINLPFLNFLDFLILLISIIIKISPILFFESIIKGTVFTFIPFMFLSFLFMINTQINHIHEKCMIHDKDFYKHQILTSVNYNIGNRYIDKIIFLFSGGLNYQIEHHLFPNVHHSHYPKIQPIVKKICIKHNIQYNQFDNIFETVKSYYSHIKKLKYNE